MLALPHDYPTLRDRISSDFHAEVLSDRDAMRGRKIAEKITRQFCSARPRPCEVVCLRHCQLSRTGG